MPRSPPWTNFHQFCTAIAVVDIITCDKFFGDRLRDVDSVGVEIGGLLLTQPLAVNTLLMQLHTVQ